MARQDGLPEDARGAPALRGATLTLPRSGG